MPGTTHRRGTAAQVKKNSKRRKLPCRSAPSVPANVTVAFGKRDQHNHHVWRARVSWDPVLADVAGRLIEPEAYQVQLRATDASGVPIETDSGNPAVWKKRVEGDEDRPSGGWGSVDPHAVFSPLARPRLWYYQARVRTENRVRGTRCYSAWSGWTTAQQPVTGALPGPPAPTGLTLTFDRIEGKRRAPFRALATWNEVPTWTPADGDTVDGANQYVVQLSASDDGGVNTLNRRRHIIAAKDEDADTTRTDEFRFLRRKRHYRVRVRAIDIYGRKGAWSAYTAWRRPQDDTAVGAAPAAPASVTVTKKGNHGYIVTWAEPTDPTDVDRYAIDIYVSGSLDHTEYVSSATRRLYYKVPKSQVSLTHRFKPRSEDEEGNTSAVVDSGDIEDDELIDGADVDDDAIPFTRLISSSARVYGNSDQNITDVTETTLGFNTTDYTADGYSPNLSADTITLRGSQVSNTGVYLIVADVAWEANATGIRRVQIETNVNSAGWNALKRVVQHGFTGGLNDIQVVYLGQLPSQNTAVRVRVYQDSGATLVVNAGRTNKALAVTYLGSNTKNPNVSTRGRKNYTGWY